MKRVLGTLITVMVLLTVSVTAQASGMMQVTYFCKGSKVIEVWKANDMEPEDIMFKDVAVALNKAGWKEVKEEPQGKKTQAVFTLDMVVLSISYGDKLNPREQNPAMKITVFNSKSKGGQFTDFIVPWQRGGMQDLNEVVRILLN